MAFYKSEEYRAAMKDHHNFSAAVLPDGSFRAEDVLPGKYEVNFHQRFMGVGVHITTERQFQFISPQELSVPEAKDKDDDSSVDWGEVKLGKYPNPVAKMANSVK